MFFLDFLHPRCWHLRKGAAAEAVLLCEEALEVAPEGLGGLISGGEGAAHLEDYDGGHSCFGLWFFWLVFYPAKTRYL